MLFRRQMRQQLQAITLVAVLGAGLTACGPVGSSSQATSLADIALHSDEVPSTVKHCSTLSGAYPAITHAYDGPEQDSTAWQAALAGGAIDAWVEVYAGRSDPMRPDANPCGLWPTANRDAGTIGPSIQNVVMKYKNVASAHLCFTRGDFVPLQHPGYPDTKCVFGGPTTEGNGDRAWCRFVHRARKGILLLGAIRPEHLHGYLLPRLLADRPIRVDDRRHLPPYRGRWGKGRVSRR